MCFDSKARPPIAPIAGGALNASDVTLTTADGTQVGAFAARAQHPTGAGIVILPDIRGLHRYYKELAERFAENGIDAIAIDYFARTAGLGERSEEFPWQQHIARVSAANVAADVAAALDYLRSPRGGGATSLFTIGFCFGGSLSYLQDAEQKGLAGVIGFYGNPVPRTPPPGFAFPTLPAPIDEVNRFTAPVLGIFGGADQGIPASAVQQFDDALTRAGVKHEIKVYPNAPHSFFDRHQAQYASESADAWQKVLEFIRANTH